MKNDKQDRKLLAQLAAGYMASTAHPAYDGLIDNMIQDSVEYAIGALAAIDALLEARRSAEVQAKELQAQLDRELPPWAAWSGNRLIAKHFCDINEPSKEIVMARADGSGWMAWIRREDQAQRWGSVSGPETGNAARAKIYEVLDWESYAPESNERAAKPIMPTPRANPDMVRAALVDALRYLDENAIAYRLPDGSPVSATDMLKMLDSGAPEAREYLHDVYGAAVRVVRVKSKPEQAERSSTCTDPSATEILTCAHEIETGRAAAILLRPVDWRDLVDEPEPTELPETD